MKHILLKKANQPQNKEKKNGHVLYIISFQHQIESIGLNVTHIVSLEAKGSKLISLCIFVVQVKLINSYTHRLIA